MGLSFSAQISQTQQDFMTSILQENQQTCLVKNTNQSNGNVVIVTGSNIRGDFTGVATVTTTDSTCILSSNTESLVDDILRSTLNQKNATSSDIFSIFNFDANVEEADLRQSVTNNIAEINQAICSTSTINSADDNYVYLSNTNVGGNFIGVSSTSNARSSCVMSNTMKNTTYNDAQSSVSQSNLTYTVWSIIAAGIVGVIALIIVGGLVMRFSRSSGTGGNAAQKTPREMELEAADYLGIDPSVLSKSLSNEKGQ